MLLFGQGVRHSSSSLSTHLLHLISLPICSLLYPISMLTFHLLITP